jgi:hypothetical protein
MLLQKFHSCPWGHQSTGQYMPKAPTFDLSLQHYRCDCQSPHPNLKFLISNIENFEESSRSDPVTSGTESDSEKILIQMVALLLNQLITIQRLDVIGETFDFM